MNNKSISEEKVRYLTHRIHKDIAEITGDEGEPYLGTLSGIGSSYYYLTHTYVALNEFEKALGTLESSVKYEEYNYEFFKYWQNEVLPFVVKGENGNLIARLFNNQKQSLYKGIKTLFLGFGIEASDQFIDKFLKNEKYNFEKVKLSNKEKFETARISIVNSIQMIEYYIVPKLLFWSQNISDLEFLKFLESSMTKAKYPGGIHYKLFTGYILGNDISKEIDFFTSKKNSYYFYVKDMAFAMKYLLENNREKFLESIMASLDGYKKDCRSSLNGFKGRYQEDFSLDALAVARLGALKGWEIDIEHEKFPKEFFNFILEKTLPK